MPTNNSLVKFKYITETEEPVILEKDNDTVYFDENDSSISVGNKKFSSGMGYIQIGAVEGSEIGEKATVEGYENIGSGDYSHAENYHTIASGVGSHAEGARNFYGVDHGGTQVLSGDQNTTTYAYIKPAAQPLEVGYYISAAADSLTFAQITAITDETLTTDITLNPDAAFTHHVFYISPGSGEASGNYSHSEGLHSTASGVASHSENIGSVASGISSHAEGNGSIAAGGMSHAEGKYTKATGEISHAEGQKSIASGTVSHAEGAFSEASGISSHVEGYHSIAAGRSQHVFGEYNTQDITTNLHGGRSGYGNYIEIVGNGGTEENRSNARTLDWYGNEVLAGKLTVGITPTATMDVATKGYVDNLDITNNFTGILSTSKGGTGNSVGYIQTGALEESTIGVNATIEGHNSIGSGNYSHTEGTIKIHNDIAVITQADIATTTYEVFLFDAAYRVNDYITLNEETNFPYAKILNIQYRDGNNSLITVDQTLNSDSTLDHVSCYKITPMTATGEASHAEGIGTNATNQASHAEGSLSTASGKWSHAEGNGSIASGISAHSENYYTEAKGNYSHAEGYNSIATKRSQHVFGEYNIQDPLTTNTSSSPSQKGTYIEIVGNGTANNFCSNARTLDWNGNEILAGKLTIGTNPTEDMDVATKKYVDDLKPLIITFLNNTASKNASQIYEIIPTRQVLCSYNGAYYPLTYCSNTVVEFGYYNGANDNAKISIDTSGTATFNIV